MRALALNIHSKVSSLKKKDIVEIDLKGKSLSQQVFWLILRDLARLNWKLKAPTKINPFLTIVPPKNYDKQIIKEAMSIKRDEIISKNKKWIDKHIDLAKRNLANGYDVLHSEIDPIIEVCETQKQHDLFRIFRYYWSSPYSEYVGRRIKIIIRDKALPNKPVIGIAALGSPIIHIPERDDFIGWDVSTRTRNLIYAMDAYVIGALPPYNYLLGGKLISYILASKEVREIYRKKYKDKVTLIDKREANQLVGIFTTSLYGKSSQYNRLKYKNELLYKPIGTTKGFGTLHLSEETIEKMQEYLKSKNIFVANKFGDGPSWTMRVIHKAGEMMGFDPDLLLKHSFKRNIYFVPLGENWKAFFNGESKQPLFYNYSKNELVKFWKERWFENRKRNIDVLSNVMNFRADSFSISSHTLTDTFASPANNRTNQRLRKSQQVTDTEKNFKIISPSLKE